MANRAYLMGWDSENSLRTKPDLEGNKYSLPALWNAIFDPDELHDVALDGEAFVKLVLPRRELEVYLKCTGAQAAERLAQRTPALVAGSKHVALAAKFVKFMSAFSDRSIVLDVSELAGMEQAGEYSQRLRKTLELIANPTTSSTQLRELGALVSAWDSDEDSDALCLGGGTGFTLQERQFVKQRRAASQVVRASNLRNDLWKASLDRCPEAERKPYLTSATFQVDDVIAHAKLGPGVVVRVIDTKKIEVQFEDGPHTLVHRVSSV